LQGQLQTVAAGHMYLPHCHIAKRSNHRNLEVSFCILGRTAKLGLQHLANKLQRDQAVLVMRLWMCMHGDEFL
jgi:hypothetical protein